MHGEAAEWSMDTFLLARAANLIQIGNNAQARRSTPKNELVQPPVSKMQRKEVPKQIPKEKREEQKGWKDLDKLFGTGG